MKRTSVVVGAVLLALVCGAALGSNMGFKLNFGVVSGLNALLSPSGFDTEGQFTGAGSGLIWSFREQDDSGDVLLDLMTPAGTISLPYTVGGSPPPEQSFVEPAPQASVRFAGTGFSVPDPITFLSADGVAEITIYSKWEGDPMVRYAGTGLLMEDPAGPVVLVSKPGSIQILAGGNTWTFTTESGSWQIENSAP